MIPILYLRDLQPEDLLNRDFHAETDVNAAVDAILAAVQSRGDSALIEYEARFDGAALTPETLEVSPEEWEHVCASVDADFLETLRQAAANIRRFHEQQVRRNYVLDGSGGTVMGLRYTPIRRVGICIPGTPTAFPSSVLMNAIPANIAGVEEIIMVTPPDRDGRISAEALAAAKLSGVTRVFRLGGAQAVAALAFGTEHVPAVDKIVGPGGAFVAAAKRKVFGRVGIDMIAGPSEILVLADGGSEPRCVAADLLSQAEHDKLSSAVLVTDSEELAKAVQRELEVQLKALPRQEVAEASLKANGKLIVTDSLSAAADAVNLIAPEHLELCVADPFALLHRIRNAGSIFLGRNAPEALGDYFAGPNHTLPTSGTARFSSPLSVDDFVKKSSFLYYTPEALSESAARIADFAEREGLHGHANSVLSRLQSCAESIEH